MKSQSYVGLLPFIGDCNDELEPDLQRGIQLFLPSDDAIGGGAHLQKQLNTDQLNWNHKTYPKASTANESKVAQVAAVGGK